MAVADYREVPLLSAFVTRTPRHGGESESFLQGVRWSARDLFWSGDVALLLALGFGVLLWPWLGPIAATTYVALVCLAVAAVYLARRRR